MGKKLPRYKDDLLCTLGSIFHSARWFGIPSQEGMTVKCMGIIMFLMLFVLEITAIWKIVRAFGGWSVVKGTVNTKISGAIFYGNALLSQILSWKFISSWQYLSIYWAKIETTVAVHLPHDDDIKKKIIVVTFIVAVCAVVEHVLSMMSATGLNCPPAEYFQRYILNSHGFLLHSCKLVPVINTSPKIHMKKIWTATRLITCMAPAITWQVSHHQYHEYSLWYAIPIFVLSKLATILWNFQDLIIILVSMGLTSRYHRLNSTLNNMLRKKMCFPTQTWRRLREAYVRQAELVRRVNDRLGALILLSNFNNLYFICLQLFLGINSEQGASLNRIYYILSLSWLIVRATGVVLAAADIHLHSRSALPLLQTCIHGAYNVEANRLKTQLKFDSVAIKGFGLFVLNRRLLLEVAAAILKYELVLIQFDQQEK